MPKAKFIQENGENILPVTHEEAVFDDNGTSIPNKYQAKTDPALNTDDKTIVGAINEILEGGVDIDTSELEGRLSDLESNKADKTELDAKANKSELDAKADKTYVDQALENAEPYDDTYLMNLATTNSAKLGSLSALSTTNKNNIVDAINELFQRGDEVKQLLVDALIAKGANASMDDTFEALVNKIIYDKVEVDIPIEVLSALPTEVSNKIVIVSDTSVSISYENDITISSLSTNKLSMVNYDYTKTTTSTPSGSSTSFSNLGVDEVVQVQNSLIYLRDCYGPVDGAWTSIKSGVIKPIFSAGNTHGNTFTRVTLTLGNYSSVQYSVGDTISLTMSNGSSHDNTDSGQAYCTQAIDLTNYSQLVVYMEYLGNADSKGLASPVAVKVTSSTSSSSIFTTDDISQLAFESCAFSKQTIDVSSLTGDYYIAFVLEGLGGSTNASMYNKVYCAYLE